MENYTGLRPNCKGFRGKIHLFAKKVLTNHREGGILNNVLKRTTIKCAPVAQLDRVFGYEPKGRGFESLLAYQERGKSKWLAFFFYLHEFFLHIGADQNWELQP